ncbi:MAG: MFS transporter [Collinsella sp.]
MTAATTPKSKSTAAALSPARTKLCLALLVLLGFSLGCSEFVVIGIESDLATELGVSLATAGQLISVFALVYAIATPVLALSTGRFRRYQLLVCYSIVFVLGNLVMALAPNFQVLFISRIILGSVSGALLAVGVTYIPELLSPQQTSLAISVVYGAFSVAMVFVTSIGKFVADTLDWHVAMYGTLTFAVLICGALVAFMPRAGQTDEPATFREQAGLLREPSIITGMLIFLFGVGSVYVFYGYVTPYLEQVLGMGTGRSQYHAYGLRRVLPDLEHPGRMDRCALWHEGAARDVCAAGCGVARTVCRGRLPCRSRWSLSLAWRCSCTCSRYRASRTLWTWHAAAIPSRWYSQVRLSPWRLTLASRLAPQWAAPW